MIKIRVYSSLCMLFAGSVYLYSQKTIKATIMHDGLNRTYSYYVPVTFINGKPTALVFNLHGYGSNGAQQEFYGDFRPIADTAGFIIVHPDGTLNTQTNLAFWNVGLVGTSTVDDIGFIHAIIDTLSKVYSIDPERIYSTGMSNGGFMSYHLACLSKRFAAIASVTGSMTTLTRLQCQNADPIPIMEIHGDADPVVAYNGSTGVLSIPAVLDFWIQKNGLNPQNVVKTLVPDINTTDGATAELYVYPGNNEVQHYKIINGGHTWPGAIIAIGTTCMDFRASEVIWNFFNKYKRPVVGVSELKTDAFRIYPNPVRSELHILQNEMQNKSNHFQCINSFGEIILRFDTSIPDTSVDVSELPSGIYFLQSQSNDKKFMTKFFKL